MTGKQRSRPDFAEHQLSRRERQIMAAVYRLGRATVAEIAENLPAPPTVDAVRRMAHILEEKGLLDHEQVGPRNVYFPTVRLERARRSAVDHLVETFFGGSTPKLVAALLDARRDDLSEEDMQRLAAMIDQAREKEERS